MTQNIADALKVSRLNSHKKIKNFHQVLHSAQEILLWWIHQNLLHKWTVRFLKQLVKTAQFITYRKNKKCKKVVSVSTQISTFAH